jgi:putative flippase GtrA
MQAMLLRLRDVTLARYALASIGALALDVGCFLALLTLAVPAALASAAGYSLGIVAHWLMSSRAVFADTVAAAGPERTRQKALFVLSALAGLALTTAIVGLGALAGADPRAAKLAAIAVSFAATWLMRRRIVFRA